MRNVVLVTTAGLTFLLAGLPAVAKHHNQTNDSTELTQCTIQGSGEVSGCSVGFKQVCEKMQHGKKCCGCVPDKNAGGTGAETPATTPAPTKFCCSAKMSAPGDTANTVRGDSVCLATQAEAEQGIRDDAQKNNWVIDGAISCRPAQ